MSRRNLATSVAQSYSLDAEVGSALRRAVEAEAKTASALAVELARDAVEAAADDRLGDALRLLSAAGPEATEVMLSGPWPWWYDKRSVA